MKTKVVYTRGWGAKVASLAKTINSGKYHVISGVSGWTVVSDGSVRALRTFRDVNKAVEYAMERASIKHGEVILHAENGEVVKRISFTLTR
jgi:hypothetical protein